MLFLCLSFTVPSTTRSPRSAGLRKHPVAIGENFGWIHFLSRDVHKCNKGFLDSNEEGILNIALLELFRITQTTLHCPNRGSSLSNRYWMGCKHYFVADRIELKCLSMRVTLDLLHEFANTEIFGLPHNCMWQSRHPEVDVSISSSCVNKPMDCSLSTGLLFLHDLRLRFRLRLCLDLNVQQTRAHNWKQVSLFLHWCFRSQVRHVCRFPEHSNRIVALPKQVSLFLQVDFLFLYGFVRSLYHLQQLLNPILSSNCL